MTKEFNDYVKALIARMVGCEVEEVFTVWQCKTLQHVKGLFSATNKNAKGLYFEATYNGITKELYLDQYQKLENKTLKVEFRR